MSFPLQFAAAGLVVSLLAAASPVRAAKYKIRWYIGHQNVDYFEIAAKDFKKDVETRSRGDISVEIMPAANRETRDGTTSTPEIAAMVGRGEAQMGHSFTDILGALDPRLHAFEAPYLFRDYRHMEGVLEGPVGEELLNGMRSRGILGLSFTYSGGASGVATTDRPIRKAEDLRGLRIGVFGDAVDEAWVASLGAAAVAIRHDISPINALASAGALDAVVITWRNFARGQLERDFKYMNLSNSTYLVSMTYINEKFLESLPKEYQTLIKDASRAAGAIERAETIALNESSKRAMLANGVRPVVLTESAKRDFIAALRPAYARSIEGLIGKDFLERIRRAPDGPERPVHIAGN